VAIVSAKADDIWLLLEGRVPGKGFPAQRARIAQRKVRQLNRVVTLGQLAEPPGNHLEALAGDRAGQHSIRVNQQFRLCFVWTDAGPAEVEFVDYH
jgi:proteic killer suppression protein